MSLDPLRRLRTAAALGTAALLGCLGLSVAAASSADAATHTRYVAKGGSDGAGTANDCLSAATPCLTVQHAVDEAAAGDTVSIGAGKFAENVAVQTSITLAGKGSTGSGRSTISGDGSANAGITVTSPARGNAPTVTVRDLDISGNTAGDGIDLLTGTLTVQNSVVDNNAANGITTARQVLVNVRRSATPAASPAATPGDAVLVVTGSTVSGNGSVVNNNGVVGEGITVFSGTMTVRNSSVSDNAGGGVIVNGGTATVTESTLDANTGAGVVSESVVSGSSGATDVTVTHSTISNTKPFDVSQGSGNPSTPFGAGALVFLGASLTVTSSTLAGNTGQGVGSLSATATVTNSTITGTKQGAASESLEPGALSSTAFLPTLQRAAHLHFGAATAPRAPVPVSLTVNSTIVADNAAPNCTGSVTDLGYNLSDDTACSFTARGSISNRAALLGPVADNGGPTETQLPAKHSPAIDHIPSGSAGCSATGTDQRGDARLVHGKCDVGAVEVAQPPVVITPSTLPDGTVGTAYHATLHASGGLGAPYSFALEAGTLPNGLSLSKAGVIAGKPTKAGTFHLTVAVDDPTLKAYTITIAAAATPSTSASTPTSNSNAPTTVSKSPTVSPSSTASLANTGANTGGMLGFGALAIGLGLVLVLLGGARRVGRHRTH